MPDGFVLAAAGVLIDQDHPIGGAVEAVVRLRAMGRPFRVLAGELDDPSALATQLGALGFSIDADEIVPRSSLPRVATELGLPVGSILVVTAVEDPDAGTARALGYRSLRVGAGTTNDTEVAADFGSWLYRTLRLR